MSIEKATHYRYLNPSSSNHIEHRYNEVSNHGDIDVIDSHLWMSILPLEY